MKFINILDIRGQFITVNKVPKFTKILCRMRIISNLLTKIFNS